MESIVSNFGWLSWIIFGAFLGGWIYSLITGHALIVGWNWTAFIVAVLGAVLLLGVLNLFFGRRRA
ncbi:MAG TPA: GlsB/YeaQ/YmgE family stress response membrane protein [Ktedonobacteraceae bacterium]